MAVIFKSLPMFLSFAVYKENRAALSSFFKLTVGTVFSRWLGKEWDI